MAKVTLPFGEQAEQYQISPEHVRISMAAAIELGLKPGRIHRCRCHCINLLQNYPEGCYANCTYCGLARERPGDPEDNSFIRVAWPLYPTRLVAEKIAERDARDGVGRVCIAQVQDPRAHDDLLEMTACVRRAAPHVPISALAMATLLDEARLREIRDAGADIVGFGLDAASEEVFHRTRGRGARGPHDWHGHWAIARAARRLFGPLKVNCHVVVGLGETDRDLVELFHRLHGEQIAAYLFSFNPEPGTTMQDEPRAPLARWRRIQLVKHLIERAGLAPEATGFDDAGVLVRLDAPAEAVASAIDGGIPFVTNGCPDREGALACNRPYGSYAPGEEYRDYPFAPGADDRAEIVRQLRLAEIVATPEVAGGPAGPRCL